MSSQYPENVPDAPAGGLARSAAQRLAGWRFPGWLFWSALLLGLLALLPLGQAAWALWSPPPAGWERLGPRLPGLFSNSLGLAAAVVLGSGCLGTALAWLAALCEFPGRRFFGWALLLPLALPPYALGFVLIGMSDIDGPVYAEWLAWPVGGLPKLRSAGGLVLSLSLSLYPYVYLPARHAFQTRSGQAMEAARCLGAGAYGAFFHVGLPVAWPWIAAGMALVAMETLADVGTVALFQFETLSTAVYQAWAGPQAAPAAA